MGADRVLTILHAPGHGPSMGLKQIERAEQTGADSIGWSEAGKIAGVPLRTRPGYRRRVGWTKTNTRRIRPNPRGDAGDTAVSIRGDHDIVSWHAEKVDDAGRPRKFAPERWLTVVTYEWLPGQLVTHVNVHPSPLFVGFWKWRGAVVAAITEVRKARGRGHHVVLTGDLQTKRWVRKMLAAAGMDALNDRIDWVAWSPSLELVDWDVLEVPHMDHPWILAKFKVASR